MPSETAHNPTPQRRIDRNALRRTFAPPVVSRSLTVAAVVGTLLNIINQGPEFIAGKPLGVMKILLTYAVPFFVASYGAYCAFRGFKRENKESINLPDPSVSSSTTANSAQLH